MANIKSAKKRIKVIETKTLRNKMIKSKLKTIIKKFDAAVASGDKLPQIVQSNIDLSGKLTEEQAEQTAGLLFVTNNICRITDRCQDVYLKYMKMSDDQTAIRAATARAQ